MMVSQCIDKFITYVSSYGAEDTVVYYRDNMGFFVSYLIDVYDGSIAFDINELKKSDFVGYISYHKNRGVKNTSVRTYARAVKVFLRYCYHEGYMFNDITVNVKYPKSDKRLIEPLTAERVKALEEHIQKQKLCTRDLLIFHLMLDCGLRRSEVVNLDSDDIHFSDNYITVRNSKNNSSRVVPLPSRVAELIRRYFKEQPSLHFALVQDRLGRHRITKAAIDKMFSRLKVVDKAIHPHLLRHTFGTSFILGGGSLEVLRILMGHTDYNVTREYLHVASQSRIVNLDIYRLDDIFFNIYNYNKDKGGE